METEPVVFLDIFKAIVLIGGTTGWFIINDNTIKGITLILTLIIFPMLTWWNRGEVYSQKTHNENLTAQWKIDSRSEKNPID